MRWTAEADRQLLICLLQTLDHNPNYEKIVSLWPESTEDPPTARAIKERISKIRAAVAKENATPPKPATPKGKASSMSPGKRTSPVKKKQPVKQEADTEDSEAAIEEQ